MKRARMTTLLKLREQRLSKARQAVSGVQEELARAREAQRSLDELHEDYRTEPNGPVHRDQLRARRRFLASFSTVRDMQRQQVDELLRKLDQHKGVLHTRVKDKLSLERLLEKREQAHKMDVARKARKGERTRPTANWSRLDEA